MRRWGALLVLAFVAACGGTDGSADPSPAAAEPAASMNVIAQEAAAPSVVACGEVPADLAEWPTGGSALTRSRSCSDTGSRWPSATSLSDCGARARSWSP